MMKLSRRAIAERYGHNAVSPDNWEDMGILRFGKDFLPPCQENKSSIMHYRMMLDALALFQSRYKSRTERKRYSLCHREAAKTTHFSYLFPLYLIHMVGHSITLFDDSGKPEIIEVRPEFIALISETGASAEQFCKNIRAELTANRELVYSFGNLNPTRVKDDFEDKTWRNTFFELLNGSAVIGIGSGQQIRGKNVRGRRPSLAIYDDLYSNKGVLTEETREKTRMWFDTEAENSLDSIHGKSILVGTMVHEDTVLNDVQYSSSWRGTKYPVISIEELEKALAHCVFDGENRRITLPSEEKIQELEDSFTTLSWKERHSLRHILGLYAASYEKNRLRYFYQEYLHILMSPDDEFFTDRMFLKKEIRFTKVDGRPLVEFIHDGRTWAGYIKVSIGVDLASGESTKSDDTAITVQGWVTAYPRAIGMDAGLMALKHENKLNGVRFPILLDGVHGKMDIHETEVKFGVVKVKKKGLVDEIFKFVMKYGVHRIVIECVATQATIAREVRRVLYEKLRAEPTQTRMPTIIEQHPPTDTKKEERIKSVLLPMLQSNNPMLVNIGCKTCEDGLGQLKTLGFGQHDDIADAIAYGFENLTYQRMEDPEQTSYVPIQTSLRQRKYPYHSPEQEAKELSTSYDWECY